MSTSQLIFTNTNISKDLWDNDIHTIQNGRKYWGHSSYLWSQRHFYTILRWPRYCIWVMGNTNEYISSNIHPKIYIKVSMGKCYTYSTKYFATKIVNFYSQTTLDTSYYLPPCWILFGTHTSKHLFRDYTS